MKTHSSTPSHDMAAEPKATQPPQSHFNTPSLDWMAAQTPARPPPTNPYRTPTRSTSPPRGDTTSPMLLLVMGVDDDNHRPTPPEAPEEGTAKRSSVLCEDREMDLKVTSRAMGRRTTPLTKAITSNPIRTVTLATKFLPEFLQEMDDQMVLLGMGGGVGFQAYGLPPPGGPWHD